MAVGERFEPGCGPAGLAEPEAIPWVRVATAAFVVAITLSMGWRDKWSDAEPPRPALQVQARDATVVPAQVECLPAARPAVAPDGAPPERGARKKKLPSHAARQKRGLNPGPAGRHQLVQAQPAKLRNEYIAARDQVAAFTGEDSGSAYLARAAARRNARAPAGGTRRAAIRG